MPHPDPFALRDARSAPDAPRSCRRAITGEAGVALPPLVDHHVHLHAHRRATRSPTAASPASSTSAATGRPRAAARRDGYAARRHTPARSSPRRAAIPSGARGRRPAACARSTPMPSTHPGVCRRRRDRGRRAGRVRGIRHQGRPQRGRRAGARRAPPSSAIVAAAREHGLPVVAHVEGDGMTRARDRRGRRRARPHARSPSCSTTPLIARAVGGGQRWISTLDIHRDGSPTRRDGARSTTSRRFRRRGRRRALRHRPRQRRPAARRQPRASSALLIAAGLAGIRLCSTRSPTPGRAPTAPQGVATFVPGAPPADLDDRARLARRRDASSPPRS